MAQADLTRGKMDTELQQNSSTQPARDDPPESVESAREQGYLNSLKKLQIDLSQKSSECELLKIRLDDSNRDVEVLGNALKECKLIMFENNEDSKRAHEEVLKSRKLEEDYAKLMTQLLDLDEETNKYKQNLVDNYQNKTNALNNFESLMSSGAIAHELEECKIDLDYRTSELYLAQAKVRNLEEDAALKEKTITELRKALEDAKITHKHEITVLEEYIHCLKNTMASYENTMASYIEQRTEPKM